MKVMHLLHVALGDLLETTQGLDHAELVGSGDPVAVALDLYMIAIRAGDAPEVHHITGSRFHGH